MYLTRPFHQLVCDSLLLLTIIMMIDITTSNEIHLDKELVSVVYSPYIGKLNVSLSPPSVPVKDTYTIRDIQGHLRIISTVFSNVVTLGMGVTYGNSLSPWNKTFSECLIATAAAELNKISNHKTISVLQGIKIDSYEEIELENAIQSTIHANSLYPNTVWGFIFNPSTDTETSQVTEVMNAFYEKKNTSEFLTKLQVGIRLSQSQCQAFVKKQNELFLKVVTLLDFIICQFYPNVLDLTQKDVVNVTLDFENTHSELKFLYPNLEIVLESGWSTIGFNAVSKKAYDANDKINIYNFMSYWSHIQNWSVRTGHGVLLFEAFDQPLKCEEYRDPTHFLYHETKDCYFGLWSLKDDNATSIDFILKSSLLFSSSSHHYIPSVPPTTKWPIIIGGIGVFFVIISVFIMAAFLLRLKRKDSCLSESEVKEFFDGMDGLDDKISKPLQPPDESEYALVLPYDQSLEIPRNKFTIVEGHVLGSGAYGIVYRGSMKNVVGPVAFKAVKVNTSRSAELKEMLAEIKIMSYIGNHPRIIRLLGAYTKEIKKGIIYIGLEYCAKGSLQNYLRKHSVASDGPLVYVNTNDGNYSNAMTTQRVRYTYDPTCQYLSMTPDDESHLITVSDMVKWSHQISDAMEYLEMKKVIHGDLATRNVLLTTEFDAKVTDFGLSRRLYTYTDYVKTGQDALPWRWMAIESLKQMTFSSKSDVWSYGITVWEIFSLGDIPYPGLNWTPDFPSLLEEGLRLFKPSKAEKFIYDLMLRCWNIAPVDRPSFHEIKEFFSTKTSHYENVIC